MNKSVIKITHFHASLVLLASLLWLGLPAISNAKPQIYEKKMAAVLAKMDAPNKYALLVGISKYHRGSKESDFDWWDLNTKGDVEILAELLVRKFEYKPENIKILSDEEINFNGKTIPPIKPTQKLIVDTFRSFLTEQAKPGDIVYFHFSGHGQAVPDNGDDEADGMDETLVPSDYVSQKDGSKNIRDDEIAVLLDGLKKKNPSNVTITLDSCFSGTATRGELRPRGGPWKGKEIDKKFAGKTDDSFGDFVTRGSTRGGEEQEYVFLSAASQRQVANETNEGGVNYGAFTYALAKAMEGAGKTTTYRDLFEKVNDYVTGKKRNQNPQIEGAQLDNLILGQGALPPQRYVSVKITSRGSPYLLAGKLQGVTRGSKFALYPPGAKEHQEGKQIAIAEITSVSATTSALKIEGNIAPEKLKEASRAFEISHSYEDVLKVAVQETGRGGVNLDKIIENLGLAQKISADDKTWNVLVRPVSDEDVGLNSVQKDFRGVVLQRQDGSIIASIREGEKMLEQIQAALQTEAKWLTVKSLEDNTDPGLNIVKLEMVPIEVELNEAANSVVSITEKKERFVQRGGKTEISVGDFVRLKIQNTGEKDVYVTVLNLSSNGKIGPAFPVGNTDNLIKAGTTYTIPYPFKITEPFGQESFRAIITAEQTDFTPLIDPELLIRSSRGSFDTRGGRNAFNSPLGKILKSATDGKRAEIGSAPASWATTTVTFFVVPRKN